MLDHFIHGSIKPFIAWLHLHPEWGFLFVFLCAFAESIPIIGLVVPGSLLMSAIGLLVGSGILPLYSTLLWAILGAFLGDLLSYAFGYFYRHDIRSIWPFRLFPTWLEKGEFFFATHGGKGIFIGRFIGPVRPLVPFVGGMLQMNPWRFLSIDFIAAVCWAPAYMLPGFIVGAASLALPPNAATQIIIYLVGLLLLISILFWLIKKLFTQLVALLDIIFINLWKKIQNTKALYPLYCLLKASHIPDDHSQLGIAIFFIIALTLFIIVLIQVCTFSGITQINMPVHLFIRSLYNPPWQHVMIMIGYLGLPQNLIIVWEVVLIYLALRRYWFAAAHWLLLGLMITGTTGILKRLTDFSRPLGVNVLPLSGAFPSGHVVFSTAMYGFLAVMLAKEKPYKLRWLIYLFTSLLILTIAFSRLYLGMHWLSDVIGGALLGITFTLFFALAYRRHPSAVIPWYQLLVVVILSLAVTCTYSFLHRFQRNVYESTPTWMIRTINHNKWWQSGVDRAPLYRENRFGKKVQTINVEWDADLNAITKQLTQQGWTKEDGSKLISTIKYFGAKDKSKNPPLFSRLYQGQTPQLVMSKLIEPDKILLILRLWDSHIRFEDNHRILWVGTLDFRHHSQYFFLLRLHKKNSAAPERFRPIIDAFIPYLNHFVWKKMPYPNHPRLNPHDDFDWSGYVLLIQQER